MKCLCQGRAAELIIKTLSYINAMMLERITLICEVTLHVQQTV